MPPEQRPLYTVNNRYIRYKYAIGNKFDAQEEKTETHTPNDEYRVPWKILTVKEKRAGVKTASKCNRKNPTNTNTLKLKKKNKMNK